MTCDRCKECQAKGNRFCIYCGEKLDPLYGEGCTHCDECRRNGDRYCRYCGKSLTESENPLLTIGFVVGFVTALIAAAILTFEYAVAIWGIPLVFPNLADNDVTLIIIVPKIITIATFSGIPAQIYYILLIIALAICLGYYFYRAYGPLVKLKNGDNKSIRNTAFFEVPVLFCTLLFWELAFVLILTYCDIPVNGLPDRETWKWMFGLLEAPVWEEIITRVLMIGVPMMLIALIRDQEGSSSLKYLFGGFGFNRPAMVLIFFSAFMFGAGHLNNWGAWKFFPTFVFGLIAGYLFCRYGVYATIVIHFLTDYLSAETWLTGNEFPLAYLLLILLSLACVPYTYIYLKRGVLALKEVFLGQNNDLR